MSQLKVSPPRNARYEHALKRISDAVKSIRYGSVEVVIQDGKVVQVETREKQRLDSDGNSK